MQAISYQAFKHFYEYSNVKLRYREIVNMYIEIQMRFHKNYDHNVLLNLTVCVSNNWRSTQILTLNYRRNVSFEVAIMV